MRAVSFFRLASSSAFLRCLASCLRSYSISASHAFCRRSSISSAILAASAAFSSALSSVGGAAASAATASAASPAASSALAALPAGFCIAVKH